MQCRYDKKKISGKRIKEKNSRLFSKILSRILLSFPGPKELVRNVLEDNLRTGGKRKNRKKRKRKEK